MHLTAVAAEGVPQTTPATGGDQPPVDVKPLLPPIFSPSFAPLTPALLPETPSFVTLPAFVKPREAWEAAPPVQPYVQQTPVEVSLHHTGSVWSGQPSAEQYLRNIQKFHTGPQREWEDIAYHFFVDHEGRVWAGRPPTVRGNPSVYYDPTGVVLICFMGDYEVQEPSPAQVAAAAETTAWVMRQFRIAPNAITGHRDHAPTTCPGANVYKLIQDSSFAQQVQQRLK